jgi:Holliday junction resolvase RusA-like endonuclease
MSTDLPFIKFTVLGEPASKANSRKLVHLNGRPAFIKSTKARNYVKDFEWQCPKLDPLLEGDLSVTITIHYASRRPDLDESVILDAMQGKIYLNDRQVKEKHIYWGLDKHNPRSEIIVQKKAPDR